jgi:CRISPR-associated protein Cas1
MSALPIPLPEPKRTPAAPRGPWRDAAPDYLPARMVNEFVYCPRLFFYEWVEGVFRESADTLEGSAQHRRVDARPSELPAAGQSDEKIHARSVTLSSERLRVIAKLDLVEAEGSAATPVDYKHGAPREGKDGIEMWPADRAQIALQAIVLRENGYECSEAVVFYQKTRQRVRIPADAALIAEAEEAVARAWDLALAGEIPAPLIDSPKCAGCSLNTICLPDETNRLTGIDLGGAAQMGLFDESAGAPVRKPPASEGVAAARGVAAVPVRQLMTPRDDLKPLYLNSQGFRVGKSGEVLQVKEKDKTVQEVRIGEICQVNLFGNIQISTQAVQSLCEAGVPVSYFSMGGYFYGITTGMNTKNVALRRSQFRLADSEWFPLSLARSLVAGKIRNQRTMLQRNHIEPKRQSLGLMKAMAERAERAESLDALLGIEGTAARAYFEEFAGMIKPGEEAEAPPSGFSFDFEGRNRRPPRDPVNALLSLAYSMLARDLTIACYAVGFDPYLGFYHQLRHGRPGLALDLMEPFRPLIADSAVLSAVNTRMVTERDFVRAGESVALTAAGRKGFFRAYELRMDSLVTHPLFEYRVSYRRLLEIQARLLARVIEGEISSYPVFVTR